MYKSLKAQKEHEKGLLARWSKLLNANGGIADEHKATMTASVLENYVGYLKKNPKLINEDRIESEDFQGINMAILGVLARAIPSIIGLELVGSQVMKTPKSPVFYKRFYKDTNKGETKAGTELWLTPDGESLGLDVDYTSQTVKHKFDLTDTVDISGTFANKVSTKKSKDNGGGGLNRVFVYSGSVYVDLFAETDVKCENPIASVSFAGFNPNAVSQSVTGSITGGKYTLPTGTDFVVSTDVNGQLALSAPTGVFTLEGIGSVPDVVIGNIAFEYEYDQENEENMAEMSFTIEEIGTIEAKKKMLRTKFTTDAEYDLKRYHNINLQSELFGMAETEMVAEINRSIVRDLRMLAGIVETLDFSSGSIGGNDGLLPTHGTPSIAGNYEDMHRYFFDAIAGVCAKMYNVNRVGKGNWILGNPITLSFLDRVPGFVSSGVSIAGGTISYAGQYGNKLKVYLDPNYPVNELLIGYKGAGNLDAGYLHCPYLPLASTPILTDPETGEPSKIFFTRFGKTFDRRDAVPNKIINGEYMYSRIILKGMPKHLSGDYSPYALKQ